MANIQEYARTREGSTISKIVVNRDLCIAAISCLAVAPDTWELDGEAKIVVKDANSIDDATLIASAEACPTKAILLYSADGTQVYPK